ncbi:MAG: hypothetical protein Kow0027_20350 [Saprospiraceae bacterium]
MNKICLPLFLASFFSFLSSSLAQYTLQIYVLDGNATTTCTDVFSDPDPMWSVQIEGQGWVSYPALGPCFTELPNLQYQNSWQCQADVPDSIEICVRFFENDPGFFNPCEVAPDCEETFCTMVPYNQQDSQLVQVQLQGGGSSAGTVTLGFLSFGFPGGLNDQACDAIDLGLLTADTTLGNADTSLYNNYCATAVNEPSPWGYGAGWVNNQAVWFTFSTGPDPSSHIAVRMESDPSGIGDPINLQAAIWTNDNGCTGGWNFIAQNHDPATWGEEILLECPQPNTTYFIMVDAVWDDPEQLEGWFGVEVRDYGVLPLSDAVCDALQLGQVPDGGLLTSPPAMSNNCSGNNTGVSPTAFSVQAGVWVSFVAPQSGHVIIDALADSSLDPIDLQLALFASSNGDCTGQLTELAGAYNQASPDESLTVHCLNPGQEYYLLVDGGGNLDNQTGIFNVTVTDGGDDTPITNQTLTICASDTLFVGNSAYTQTGSFADTIILASGCDSIVLTELTVLTPITLNLEILQQGLNPGNTDGVAQVSPTGGAGGYSIAWSDGQNSSLASQLIGGDFYCVTATDALGCEGDTCFTMPFFVNVQPIVQVDSVQCPGGSDGSIQLSAHAGEAPYQFQWESSNGVLNGSGMIALDSEFVSLPNLPAGDYNVTIADANTDSVFVVTVPEPAAISLSNLVVTDLSCFGSCDGQIQVTVAGGTAPYQLSWSSGGSGASISDLCAGVYVLAVTDAHGCGEIFEVEVIQPAAFLAAIAEVQPISCFGGSDGQLSVSTNGSPVSWQWNTGGADSLLMGLPEGNYSVTVTNADGCTAEATYQLTGPSAPAGASIAVTSPVICHDDANGALTAIPSGPGASFFYEWNTGSTFPSLTGLPAGSYTVTITNESGCSAEDSVVLTNPPPITSLASTNSLSCFDPPDGGVITVESASGGIPPYLYSSDGLNFSSQNELPGYTAGEQVYFVQDSLGCVETFFTTIPGPLEIIVEAGADQVIGLGDQVFLQAFVNLPDLQLQWQPAELFSCPTCLQTSVFPYETTTVSLTATDTFGCSVTDELVIQVLPRRRVFVPNVFSPDGDGINDIFVPEGGNDVAEIIDFKVFDRYGALLHEASDFPPGDISRGWDGRHKGKLLKSGVFVWFAKIRFIDGVEEIYRGDVTIMR